jgi:hypothetical protein
MSEVDMHLATYRPSGRSTTRTLVLGSAAIILISIVAHPYQHMLNDPSASMRKVAVGLAMAVAGFGAFAVGSASRNRSRRFAVGLGLAMTASFLAAGHLQAASVAVAKGAPADWAANTWWRLEKGTRMGQGWRLAAAWAIELLLVTAAAVGGGLHVANTPFCERCGRFASTFRWALSLTNVTSRGISRLRKATTVDDVLEAAVDPTPFTRTHRVVFKTCHCPSCRGVVSLDVRRSASPAKTVSLSHLSGVSIMSSLFGDTMKTCMLPPEQEAALLAGIERRCGPLPPDVMESIGG